MTLPYDTYTYDEFDEITFDHTNMFVLNPHKNEMQLRNEYSLLYSTFMIACCVFIVSGFLAENSIEYRRSVNYYVGSYIYDTGEESDSDSEESDSEEVEDYSPTKAGYAPSVRRGLDTDSTEYSESESEEPEEASEGDTGEYDIPQPDYNGSNLNERIYRLD